MYAFATVDELLTDTTAPGISLAGKYPAYKDIEFQYSMTEDATHEVTIPTNLSAESLEAAIESGSISFELTRDTERGYMDPELYPNPWEGGALSEWLDQDDKEVFKVEKMEADGQNLVVTIKSTGMLYYTNNGPTAAESQKIYTIPHTNGASYIDFCGYFDLTAKSAGDKIGSVHSKVVPYDAHRTVYELYDEIAEIAKYDGERYVEVGSIGQTSVDNYDIPYVIVSDAKKSVEKWLEYTELSETDPEKALENIKAGKYDDMRVPVYVSNCHTNETSAVNGIMEFIQVLLNDDEVSLNTLESYTEEGEALLENEKTNVFGRGISQIYAEFATELGRLRGENGIITNRWGGVEGVSGLVDFEKYYNTSVDEFSIDELLDDVFFVCVPTMNVEGYENGTRATGVGYDPNRDYANQTMWEDANAMAFMAKYNPMVYTEIHGLVEGMLVEPCGAPHNPCLEYDILAEQFIELGEALGNAAIANNEKFNSYELPARDYIEINEESPTGLEWGSPWDDLSTNYGAQFPVFYGTCGITWEMPAYDDITATQVIPNGMLGQGRYVQENKLQLMENQAKLFLRGVTNANSNDEVSKYFVSQYDEPYAQADIMRPVYDGEGENNNFYPECLIIPVDKENQRNIQDAAEAIKWIARNDMKYMIAEKSFTYDGVEYPEGTIVASMYQAKRSLLYTNLGPGSFVTVWAGLYSEAFSQLPDARGYDIITVAEPEAYKTIEAACKAGYDYSGTLSYLANFTSQFDGVKDADVIISNASEDTAGAVNALLKAGKTVAMITEGDYMGDFICSYEDFKTVADDYLLSAKGVYGKDIKASVIKKAPEVFVTGKWIPSDYGYNGFAGWSYSYNFDVDALGEMGFSMVESSTGADAIVGTASPTGDALEAVKSGTPLMVWGGGAGLRGVLDGQVARTSMPTGTDALAYVEYPTVNLINANYVLDGDDQNYQYGTAYFSQIPEGAKVLVKNAGKTPTVGCICILDDEDEANFDIYNNAAVAFEYQNDGMDIVAFANTLDHKDTCTDEYKYIANFLFSRVLGDEAYAGTEAPAGGDEVTPTPGTPTAPGEDSGEDVVNPEKPAAGEDSNVSETGDSNNMMIWVAVMLLSIVGGTIVVVRKRQKDS